MRRFAWIPLLCLLIAGPAAAQTDSPFSEIDVDYTFAERITVRGRIDPSVRYDALAIHIDFPGQPATLTAPLEAQAGGEFSFEHRIADGFVRAFSTVTFRFVLSPEGGGVLTSEPYTFFYTDNRFQWQSLEQAPFTVHWYAGDSGYTQQILDAAQAGLARGMNLLETPPLPPIDIYAYASQADYQLARGQIGRLWAGGHADPQAGLILASLPPGPEAVIEIDRKIPHEVAHLALAQAAGPGFNNLPDWLNEGIASALEISPDPDYDFVVAAALAQGRTLPFESLCESFPAEPDQALLAYAQSTSLVRYIETRYGPAGLRALVRAYAGGAGCALGTQAEPIGQGLEALGAEWAAAQRGTDPPAPAAPPDVLPWLLVFAAVLVGPGLVLIGSAFRKGTAGAG